MLILFKVLILLWLINFAPPFFAYLLGNRWNSPIDGGYLYRDGNPFFGSHKTRRGFLAGAVIGCIAGWAMGFPLWLGLLTGLLSMSGDLLSSFIKRRLSLPEGSAVLGLDQIFEGLLPFIVLAPYLAIGSWNILLLIILFTAGAYLGSIFLKEVLQKKPFENYPRNLNSRVRLREFRACQITSDPLHVFLNFEDAIYYHIIMKSFFRILGLYDRGRQNALKVEVSRVTFDFRSLPPAFDGYKILFLSDLHLDGLEGLTEKLQSLVRDLPVDLCIIGGDLRMETYGPFSKALAHMRRLLPEIRAKDGIIGILGNHDCTEMIEPLEKCGMTFLINDSLTVKRNGNRIWFAGVDDPHRYRCHDLSQAFQQVQDGEFVVFLAHSNEVYHEAQQSGAALYLCGHSHGGQILLPYIGPLFTHSRAPRRYYRGAWRYQGMIGYTSHGAGVSGVPLRFLSEGEVVLITLRTGQPRRLH